MQSIEYDPIGYVASPFDSPYDVPRPADDPVDARGRVILEDQYEPGLLRLEEFSHVQVIAHLHETDGVRLQVEPGGAIGNVGVFATSGPARPNPIAVSILRLEDVSGATLSVSGIDLIDGTPVLDVKPFAPKAAQLEGLEMGWMASDATE